MNACRSAHVGCRGLCGLPKGHDGEHQCGTKGREKREAEDRMKRKPDQNRQINNPGRDRS